MNKAIAWKTDEHFTDGKEYECSCTYNNMIEIVDDSGELIQVGLDDPGFTIMLNVRTCDGCSIYGDFYKPECGECRISGKGKDNNYSDESSTSSEKDCLTCGIGTNESTYCNGCIEFSKWFKRGN